MMTPLQRAIESADLPDLVATHYPDSGAEAGEANDHIKAVWRDEKHGSVSLHKHEGVWFLTDHAEGESYNAYSFLTKIAGLSRREAARVLVQDEAAGAESAYSKFDSFQLGQAPDSMLKRGFTMEDLELLNIRNVSQDTIIPIYDHDGVLVNVKRRFANPDGGKKYMYEVKGVGSCPWYSPGFDEGDHVLVVEGELNAMMAWLLLKLPTAGMPGADQDLPPHCLEDRAVYVYADSDGPGRKAVDKWAKQAHGAGALKVMGLAPLPQDFCDVAGSMGKEELHGVLNRRITNAKRLFGVEDRIVAGTYSVAELRTRVRQYITNGIVNSTGWPSLDRLTGGIPESGIIHYCALSSMGKSIALRHTLLHHVLKENRKVMLFSPDQSPAAIYRFIASIRSGIPFKWLRDEFYPPELLDGYGSPEKIVQAYYEVYDDCILHLSKRFKISEADHVATAVKEMERAVDRGFDMFGGDYIQAFYRPGSESEDDMAIQFKTAVRRLKVPMIFAVQLGKYKFPWGSRRNGLPFPEDIRGTGEYYNIAEQVYMLYNRDMYWAKYVDPEHPPKEPHGHHLDRGHVRMIVHKNKDDDAIVDNFVRLRFNRGMVDFEDVS